MRLGYRRRSPLCSIEFSERVISITRITSNHMITSALMSEATGRKSILFVDDEEKVLDAFRRMLRPFSETWNVHFLSDSRRALELAKDYRVDAVVTDLCMPFVSGIELIQEGHHRHRRSICPGRRKPGQQQHRERRSHPRCCA